MAVEQDGRHYWPRGEMPKEVGSFEKTRDRSDRVARQIATFLSMMPILETSMSILGERHKTRDPPAAPPFARRIDVPPTRRRTKTERNDERPSSSYECVVCIPIRYIFVDIASPPPSAGMIRLPPAGRRLEEAYLL